jgi:hypothetical protein
MKSRTIPVPWPLLLILHFLFATLGGMVVGFIPEVVTSRLFYNTGIEAYSPLIALTALVLGYFAGARVLGFRAGNWTWTLGLIWLLIGVRELTSYWNASWSPEKTRWEYALANLFGPTLRCSGTECLYEFLFTTPFVASLTYSIGLYSRKRREAAGAASSIMMKPKASTHGTNGS